MQASVLGAGLRAGQPAGGAPRGSTTHPAAAAGTATTAAASARGCPLSRGRGRPSAGVGRQPRPTGSSRDNRASEPVPPPPCRLTTAEAGRRGRAGAEGRASRPAAGQRRCRYRSARRGGARRAALPLPSPALPCPLPHEGGGEGARPRRAAGMSAPCCAGQVRGWGRRQVCSAGAARPPLRPAGRGGSPGRRCGERGPRAAPRGGHGEPGTGRERGRPVGPRPSAAPSRPAPSAPGEPGTPPGRIEAFKCGQLCGGGAGGPGVKPGTVRVYPGALAELPG